MTKHSSSKKLFVRIELSQKFKRLNAVTIMSDDEDGLFEQMTADVIVHLGSMRSDRLVAAAWRGWCGLVCARRAHRTCYECATEMARWSRQHRLFYAMLAHQQSGDASRRGIAEGFRRLGLLQSYFSAWGPLFKLQLAERIGEADRCLRRTVIRSRLRATLNR